ncbi:MAG: hypothetical protein BGO31_13215 [Bacteroidetes bacterium 43-16]|nr:MAG: hypothetical protein BGO31_13215 [Bacteroidetes bacterium 43-16]
MIKTGILLLALTGLVACAKTEQARTYSKDEVKRIVDSTILSKANADSIQNARDFEIRKAIEIRSRMDSIQKAKKEKK